MKPAKPAPAPKGPPPKAAVSRKPRAGAGGGLHDAPVLTPESWFAAGRIKACQSMPYFTAAIMGLVPYQKPGLGTFAVTRQGVVMWDPALADTWTIDECAAVVLHEAGHYVRDHAGRCGERHHEVWNVAGDAEINDDLVAAGLTLPGGCVVPKSIGCDDGRLAEEYYDAAMKKAVVVKMPCGSGAGNPHPEEGDVPGELGQSSATQKRIQHEVAEGIRQHAQRGTVPGELARWAEGVLGPPVVPWQQRLAVLARRAVAYRPGVGDYSYAKPSRRQSAYGNDAGAPVLPAARTPVPSVACIVDTSGSMGAHEMRVALNEVSGVLQAIGTSLTFIACDADVHSNVSITNVDQAVRALKGGGGTDMTPAFAAAQAGSTRPDVIVCVTDGHIGDPGPAPRASVIWIVAGHGANAKPAPWGDVVVVPAGAGGP